jgi:hypothetical protein
VKKMKTILTSLALLGLVGSAALAQTNTPTSTRTPTATRTRTPTRTITPTRTQTPWLPIVQAYARTYITTVGAITRGKFVGFNNAQMTVAGAPVLGVAMRTYTGNSPGSEIVTVGPVEVVAHASTAFNIGDPVASDSAGAAVVAGPTDWVAGFVRENRLSSSAGPVKILLSPGAFARATATGSPTPTFTATPVPTDTPTETPTPP